MRISARRFFMPTHEGDVIAILRQHAGEEIRAVGRLHSWSPAIQSAGVLLDLRHMNDVVVHCNGDEMWAEVGAGCQIKRLLAELRQRGLTTLSQGLIKEQSLAGAAATGTHGSGGHSFSHAVQAVRLVRYQSGTEEPCMETIELDGPELRAARCSLGCLGIITRLRIAIRPAYFVEEQFRRYDTLESVLAAEREYPLQQFYLAPWRWDFFAQHRREIAAARSRTAPLYRLYWSVGMDRLFHLIIRLLAWRQSSWFTKFFYRRVLALLVPQGWKVVDRSDLQLSMAHELYRHIETELFVTGGDLPVVIEFLKLFLQHASGENVTLPESVRQSLLAAELWPRWEACRGVYLHHYPLCIRKILPDDTLISMSAGAEPRYSISLITYAAVDHRQGFYTAMEFLTKAMMRLFQARPHWGKHCPLHRDDVPPLYPQLGEFQRVVGEHDPEGRFANSWIKGTILAPTKP